MRQIWFWKRVEFESDETIEEMGDDAGDIQ
jgi:hypothetical protein